MTSQELISLENQQLNILHSMKDIQVGTFVQSQGSRFVQFVTDSSRTLGGLIASLDEKRVEYFSSDYRLNSELGRSEYVAIRDLQMQVPAGLNVSFLSYAEVLRRATHWVNQTVIPTLTTIEKYINRAAGHETFFDNTLSDPMAGRVVEIGKQCKELKDQIAKCYDPASNKAVSSFGRCFNRNKEWIEVSEIVADLTQLHEKIKVKEIQKQVQRLSKSCEYLIGAFEDSPSGRRSETKTAEVATILFNAAQLVEFTGALVQMNVTFIEVMAKNKTTLLKIF